MYTEEGVRWYYPFRMPKVNELTMFEIPEQTRYLFCKTWKASVLVCDRGDGGEMDLLAIDPNLREESLRIGETWLYNVKQFEEGNDAVTEADGRTAVIDVVAISRSTFDGRQSAKDGKPWLFEDSMNILWVKWQQGVAYRVASGYVYEEDWKRLDLEEIDLVLG
jgi:hypothetical protein